MAKRRIRIGEADVERLDALLKDAFIETKDAGLGRVTKVTKGGIQVQPLAGGGVRPYSIYQSFVSGDLRLVKHEHRREVMYALSRATGRKGEAALALVATEGIAAPVDPAQTVAPPEPTAPAPVPSAPVTSPELPTSVGRSAQSAPVVEHVDVAGNIRLVCYFRNVNVRFYLLHMRSIGLEGFGESLERGVAKNPFIVLRETQRYLKCSVNMLLYTFEEFLRNILEECELARDWGWSEATIRRTDDGKPYKSVGCRNADGVRNFVVNAVFDDEDMRQCCGIQANFVGKRRGASEIDVLKGVVREPSKETMDVFEEAFRKAEAV
ncbi:MAG: hypothetical protein IKG21_01855 [Atopobiaceae bacterium]|nr:hypothetical protein [Atopobiaceae bacterium]